MDMYKLKWTRLQSEIFRFLCIKSGQSFNLRGLAKPLKVSPTAVSKSLINLEKVGLVIVKKFNTMNLLSIELNRDNSSAIYFKRLENLKMIYESGIVEILKNKFPSCAIILFGSYSYGEDVYGSDVDMAIIGTKGKKIDLVKFEKLFEREIRINFYKDLKDIGKNLRSNIFNGIVLAGRIGL